MITVHIITSCILDKNNNIQIGGIENYTNRLAELFSKHNFKVFVYEYGNTDNEINLKYYTVKRIKGNSSIEIIRYIDLHCHDYENDIVIFSTDYLICKNKFMHCIAIQHGISWDVSYQRKVSFVNRLFYIFYGAFRSLKKIIRFENCNNIVCVDYNFVNWYRTQMKYFNERLIVIPNFADCLVEKPIKNCEEISIIFARRFVTYRGTKLFSEAISNVLLKHPEVKVTIAGTGPDEDWMRTRLKNNLQVSFTSFDTKDSIAVHAQHDIAVIPTLGSEGTSLSLLEAMAAGCAVIATNIGGMTNIILDGYNGLLINPEQKALEESIIELIENGNKRKILSDHAYETVKDAFSYKKWSDRWLKLIKNIYSESIL